MSQGDLLGNPEPKPASFFFGREIWFEHRVELLRRNSGPAILDFDQDTLIGKADAQPDPALAADRLESINHEVQ